MTGFMATVAAAGAAGVAVVAAARAMAPPPARLRSLAAPPGRRRAPEPAGEPGHSGLVLAAVILSARVGRPLRRVAARPGDPTADARWGAAALVAALVPWAPAPAVLLMAVVLGAPVLLARRARQREEAEVVRTLPEAVDLLRLGVDAGLTPALALAAAAPHVSGRLGSALAHVVRQVGAGRPLGPCLADLGSRFAPAHGLTAALGGALADGTPLGPVLERLSGELRSDRRRRAEEAARRLPVKMLFPLVCCALPAVGLLTLVPLVAASLSSLRL